MNLISRFAEKAAKINFTLFYSLRKIPPENDCLFINEAFNCRNVTDQNN